MKRKSIFILLILFLATGFRTFPGSMKWTISAGDPDIWIRICERPDFTNDNLPDEDPLKGASLSFNNVIQSIKEDYNNTQTTFISLKDAAVDSGFDPNTARIIDVCFSGLILASGVATRNGEGSIVVSCDIKLDPKLKSNVSNFISTVTHELGHCMGLDHTQDLTNAIMSYFSGSKIVRLQGDDKMGLTYLYPSDPSYAQEAATFGLSCDK